MATSVIDYIFRELAVTYLGRNDLAHVKEDEIETENNNSTPSFNFATLGSGGTTESQRKDHAVILEKPGNGTNRGNSEAAQKMRAVEQAREQGFTGDVCPECGSMTMVRNGTCLKCTTCGATTGCS